MSTKTSNLELIKPELKDAADITAMNENWDEIDSRLGTLANCGYGEQMDEISASNIESYAEYCAKIDNILANMSNRTIKLVSATPPYDEAPSFGACAAILYKGTADYASLIPIGHSNIYAYGWRMQKRNGTWQPFEWDNPPMEVGVEYRTTERWMGKPVYTKLLTGTFEAGDSDVYLENRGVLAKVFDVQVSLGKDVYVTDYETQNTPPVTVTTYMNGETPSTTVRIHKSGDTDLAGWVVNAVIKYTKE